MATGATDEAIMADFECKLTTEQKGVFETRKRERAVVRSKLTRALNMMTDTIAETSPSALEIEFCLDKVISAYNELETKDLAMSEYLDQVSHARDADQRIG